MIKKEKKPKTHTYNGWLVSDNFLKRAFAVYGYSMVAGLITGAVVLVLVILFMIVGMLIGMVTPF